MNMARDLPPPERDVEVCWHCGSALDPAPPPHCEQCPPFGDCDVEDCLEPGCAGELACATLPCPAGPANDAAGRLDEAVALLRRVLYEPNSAARNVALIQDIRRFVEDN